MTQADLEEIADVLRTKIDGPWRTFEALARINSAYSLSEIERALKPPNLEVRMAAARFAKGNGNEKEQILVEALDNSEFYGGLTQALDQVETFHPPGIVDALLRGLLRRGDSGAVNFAGISCTSMAKLTRHLTGGRDFYFSDSGQKISKFARKHSPSSVELLESMPNLTCSSGRIRGGSKKLGEW